MTGPEFRALHGDPATWTDDDYRVFEAIATPGPPITDPDPADFESAA